MFNGRLVFAFSYSIYCVCFFTLLTLLIADFVFGMIDNLYICPINPGQLIIFDIYCTKKVDLLDIIILLTVPIQLDRVQDFTLSSINIKKLLKVSLFFLILLKSFIEDPPSLIAFFNTF